MIEYDDSLVSIGKRLIIVRTIADFSRKELAKAANVSLASISYWENATTGEISPICMEDLLKAFESVGVVCKEPWLRKGEGDWPIQKGKPIRSFSLVLNKIQELKSFGININEFNFNEELVLFISKALENKHDPVVFKMINHSMNPVFVEGDVVGGFFVPISEIDLSDEKICIVKINNTLDIWRVKRDALTEPAVFTLSHFSYDSNISAPLEIKIKLGDIAAIAPVSRVWRNAPFGEKIKKSKRDKKI